VTDETGSAGSQDGRLTDDAIRTTRRDALRRMGRAAAAVALGGLAAACAGDNPSTPGARVRDRPYTIPIPPDVAGATLRRLEYSGSGRAGSDTDVSRTADPKGDNDVSTTGDPPGDGDVTVYGDAPGTGTDADPFDDPGTGTDTDVTVYADPPGDGDVSTTADPKGDADVTTTADPVS